MKLLISGATGFIGKTLCQKLFKEGHELVVLARDSKKAVTNLGVAAAGIDWEAGKVFQLGAHRNIDAVVHLAGESIAGKRWSEAQKKKIMESRVEGTESILKSLRESGAQPKVFLTASAIGIYGDRGSEWLTEETSKPSGDFLSDVCSTWEKTLFESTTFINMRKVALRFGMVLGCGGGALEKLLPLFKLGLGGKVGSGKQWVSWIHRDDLIRMILFALTEDKASGAFNAVASEPVTNTAFTESLAKALRRPAIFAVPAFALKLALGEMSTIVLASQRVSNAKIQRLGFVFDFDTIDKVFGGLSCLT